MKKKNIPDGQYSLMFGSDDSIFDDKIDITGGRIFHESLKIQKVRSRMTEYDLFSQMLLVDFLNSGLINNALLNILIDNGKEKLVELLYMSSSNFHRLRGVGKSKVSKLIDLQKDILDNPDPYLLYYKEVCCDRFWPEYENADNLHSLDLLLLFIREYVDYLRQNDEKMRADILSYFIGLNGERKALSYKEIADIFDLSIERIRQILVVSSKELMDCLQGSKVRNFQASELLKEAYCYLLGLRYVSVPIYLIKTFFPASVEKDSISAFNNFLNIFKIDLCIDTHFCGTYYIPVPFNEIGMYRSLLKILLSKMRRTPFWWTEEEIIEDIDKERVIDEYSKKIIFEVLLHHPCFEQTFDHNYRLKWEFLNAVSMEVYRILFDSRCLLCREEILEAYNFRSLLSGKKAITGKQLIFASNEQFVCQSKSGLWVYKPNRDTLEDVRIFINSYIISQGGKILFDELLKVVRASGYPHPDTTIRAYALIFCRTSLKNLNLLIHNDFVASFPDIPLRKRNCVTSRRQRSSSEYHYEILEFSVKYLRCQTSCQCRMSDLFNECKTLVPEGKRLNIVYRIWRDSNLFVIWIDEKTGKKWVRLKE